MIALVILTPAAGFLLGAATGLVIGLGVGYGLAMIACRHFIPPWEALAPRRHHHRGVRG